MVRETRTFLAADIVGSTQRWTEDETAMAAALAAFDAVVEEAVSSVGGDLFKHTGDGFFEAFADPAQAERRRLAEAGVEPEPWPMDPEHREATLERLGDAVDRALADG